MVWNIFAAWSQIWILPWAWALVVFGLIFIARIPWKSKVLPWALAYILFTSTGFAYQHRNFPMSPSTLSALLGLFTFLMYCSMPDFQWRWKARRGSVYQTVLLVAGIIGVLASLWAIFFPDPNPDGPYLIPVFWNRSMGGAFTVAILSCTPLWWLGLIVVLCLKRFTPTLMFAAFFIMRRKSWRGRRLVACLGMALGFVIWKASPWGGLEHHWSWNNLGWWMETIGTGRWVFWSQYWDYLQGLDDWTTIFGTHLGTTSVLLPIVQAKHGVGAGEQYYIWLHNDFYQAWAEFGTLGMALFIASFIEVYRKCDIQQKALGVTLLVGMIGNFPWHWVPECFIYWWWIKHNAIRDIPQYASCSQAQQPCSSLGKTNGLRASPMRLGSNPPAESM